MLSQVRARLAEDLDTAGAIAAVDRWVEAAEAGGEDEQAPSLVRDTIDALLGVVL